MRDVGLGGLAQLLQARLGQDCVHDAPIRRARATLDETRALETVEEPGHARGAQQYLFGEVDATHPPVRAPGEAEQHAVVAIVSP